MAKVHVMRVARPSDNIDDLLPFYCEGLGFKLLSRFAEHEGFDGIILGHPNYPYHLEFTHAKGHKVGRAPTQDHLLAFYLPDNNEWTQACERMKTRGFSAVKSFNPYWDRGGQTFEDPDGYRVVLFNEEAGI